MFDCTVVVLGDVVSDLLFGEPEVVLQLPAAAVQLHTASNQLGLEKEHLAAVSSGEEKKAS